MPAKNTGTEVLLKETAKRIFLVEGRLHATTDDIAKEAGVPRTSVHYYFRSRDLLFKQVFNEAMTDLTTRLDNVVESSLPFREKIENFIDICLKQAFKYPYIETFMITEIISQDLEFIDKESPVKLKILLKEIKIEMNKGRLAKMNPVHFIINLFSLITYPSLAAPLYRKLFATNHAAYLKLLKERKQVILKVLFQE